MRLLIFLAKQDLANCSSPVHRLLFLSVPFPSPHSGLVAIMAPNLLSYKLCENRHLCGMIALNILTERLNIYSISGNLTHKKGPGEQAVFVLLL